MSDRPGIQCPKCESDQIAEMGEGYRCGACGHVWGRRFFFANVMIEHANQQLALPPVRNPVEGVRSTFAPGEMAGRVEWGHLWKMMEAVPEDVKDLCWYLHPKVYLFMQKCWYTKPTVNLGMGGEDHLRGLPVCQTEDYDTRLMTLHGLDAAGNSWAVSLTGGLEMYVWGVQVDGE